MSDKLFKLSLFAKTTQLRELPGQERGRVFMIVESIRPQPEKSMGYLVEPVASRKVKIHAWLALGGAVYECDEPLSERPSRDADAGMSKDDEGDVFFYVRPEGRPVKVVRFTQRPQDYKLTVATSMNDMGAYGKGAYDIDEMGAACFVLYHVLSKERGDASSFLTVGDILDGMIGSAYPDALDEIVYRGRREGASDFERFASRTLMDAGAEGVRPIAAAHDIDLRRLGSTGLFWTGCDKRELTPQQVDTLQAVEGALNRLVFMEHYLGEESSPMVGAISEHECERAALQSLSSFAEVARTAIRASDRKSDYSSLLGTDAARGGEWDVRTRFAAAAEGLRAPFGFDYLFGCDTSAGVFSIDVAVPVASAFPASGTALTCDDMQVAYLLRLSMALAAIAFGSSVGVIRAVVTTHERDIDGAVVCSAEFSRQLFTMETVPAIQTGAILEASLSVEELIKMLSLRAINMERDVDGSLVPVERIDAGLPNRDIKMANDRRSLPAHLVGPLRAKTVAELDIFDVGDDPLRDRYRELCDRVHEQAAQGDAAAASATAEVSDIIAAYDAADVLQESDARPLYCSNMIARIAVGLFDEDPSTTYRKIPDTAFDARSLLCRLYRDQGNNEDAIRLGEELVRLAPTSFASYHTLALSYREAGRDSDAARVILDSMRVAVDPNDIACGYYRLGFLFWQGGDPSLGLACYAMVARDSFFYGETQAEMRELMQEAHLGRPPARDEAVALLRAEGVPVAPVSQLRDQAAMAAIGLVDAGIFNAATALVHFLSTFDVAPNSFDVLASVRRSLMQG
ncbi:lipopolysaccharide assembly protein LapB [uncultured Collinsella sp.]|uniref:tetratricopeptide repeat protein n=1 Tax=uncultured Collinsella sp. TaxID=165190 RepID=UPI002671105F|nr:bacterial transcriptional activator domain-containing protein [uncultured Collinsella sp.]